MRMERKGNKPSRFDHKKTIHDSGRSFCIVRNSIHHSLVKLAIAVTVNSSRAGHMVYFIDWTARLP